jgi:uncharacterized protein YkwD
MSHLINHLHHLFVPSKHNNFRAKVLQHDALIVYLVIAFLMLIISKTFPKDFSNSILGKATDIKIEALLEETNVVRVGRGLEPLVYNEQLASAAESKAKHMFINNYWAHFAPTGESPWDFIKGAQYEYEYAGENLAKNFLFSNNVVDAWMNSPTHRENILRPEFREVGFAVVDGVLQGEETTLVVQMFGAPLGGKVAGSSTSPEAGVRAPVVEVPAETSVASTKQTATVSFVPNRQLVLLGFLALFIGSLALDLYIASRLKVIRLHGKTIAHIIFFITIALGVILFLNSGAII